MEKKIQILLVDDERDFLEPITVWLEAKGYDVITANNGEQALKVLESKQPDIVFLDIRMPVLDGIGTLTRIRETNKELPVIMLTAYGEEKTLSQARHLGVSGFFPKRGEDFARLTTIIETTLRTHKNLRKGKEGQSGEESGEKSGEER